MKLLLALLTGLALLILLVPLMMPGVAFAQAAAPPTVASTGVTVPIGAWLGAVLPWADGILATLMLGAVTYASAFLPASIRSVLHNLNMTALQPILQEAIDHGINAIEGAAKGQQLTVNVGSAVLATALQYAIDQAPGWLLKWAGGADAIRDKLFAMLDIEPAASAPVVMDKAAAAASGSLPAGTSG